MSETGLNPLRQAGDPGPDRAALTRGADMAQVPAGAQRSDDGYYWWDGTAWQQIPEDERVSAASGAAGGGGAGGGGMSHEELAEITSADQLDDRSKPYFQPDADMYPDDASDAESADTLSDEPAPETTGGTT
jgi:hypothetical protein